MGYNFFSMIIMLRYDSALVPNPCFSRTCTDIPVVKNKLSLFSCFSEVWQKHMYTNLYKSRMSRPTLYKCILKFILKLCWLFTNKACCQRHIYGCGQMRLDPPPLEGRKKLMRNFVNLSFFRLFYYFLSCVR